MSSKLRLDLTYHNSIRFEYINLMGYNEFFYNKLQLDATFKDKPDDPDDDHKKGLKWYYILLISLGGVALIGGVSYLLWIRRKKRNTRRE